MAGSDAPSPIGLWRGARPLLLASTSRTRKTLLEDAGFPVETRHPDLDERAIEARSAGLTPSALAERLALAKAQAVAATHPDRVVLGADQVLELDGRVLHKPADREAAHAQLRGLQGRRHALHSAVAIIREGGGAAFHESAFLTMRPLDAAALDAYLALAGPSVTESVGGYQLERLGIHLFERIEGEHATILGLPMLALTRSLRAMALLAF